jgi:hypothetical protein
MDKLMTYYEHIDEEIDDAKEYAELALKWADCPEEARVALSLSSQELDHAQVLQGLVTRKLDWMKNNHHEHYEKVAMMESHRHARDAKRIKEVKMLHEIFAEHR